MKEKKLEKLPRILLCIGILIFSLGWGFAAAFADDGEGGASLSGLSISGPSSVSSGGSASYKATAQFSDGTTSAVTSNARWSLSSTTYATISSSGVLTAKTVSTNHSVTITARYSYNGVTRSAQKTATITAGTSTVTLTGLTISGPATVAANSTATYTATASFSNGTTQNVTTAATWSDNSSYGTMSSSGVMTTTAPTTNQSVTVSASYTSGGITKSATLPVTITAVSSTATLTGLTISGPATVAANSTASYTATASFSNGTTQNVTTSATWNDNSSYATMSTSGVMTTTAPATNQSATVSASYTSGGISKSATLPVTITAATLSGAKSISSTSQNMSMMPAAPVAEQTFTTLSGFNVFANNDLGMHCGDLDHRIASILPPFNVLHAQVIQKGTSALVPEILTSSNVKVIYSAASNPNDPALANPAGAPIFKTNFWDMNSAQPGTTLAFDGYNPFYPPGILSAFPLTGDIGLPAVDLNQLYPVTGSGVLAAVQQKMPGVSAPYSANVPQAFSLFDTDFPFFINFPFGYRQTAVNWFAADGIPATPFDDSGRKNAFPLMRVQAVTTNTALTGTAGAVLASVDTVTPVSSEATCFACHTSAADGGGGNAACIPGVDANCTVQGSLTSGTAFIVATASQDTSNLPADGKKEWAADNNIIRLHDAKHGTHLQAATPVVCQTCHYTPALDLAQLGPMGPPNANANGRDQLTHTTNSRALHAFHSQFTNLFSSMPAISDPSRTDASGNPTINTLVLNTLNTSCYRCHPGQNTKCLRGTMYSGGMVCQDCHGNMAQVGNDFSQNLPTSPFPTGADLTKRVPWANEPACQSCHTGDAMSNLATSANVVASKDGIHLLQAYHTNDSTATPIVATNTRFAEETASNGNRILYRLSKGHSGIFCEACHGSTHAEWPVAATGSSVPNDNMAATQLQGHAGKIIECTACHTAGSLPISLGGPHGMHPVNDNNFADGGHNNLVSSNKADCQACHGQTGQGTVLSKVAATRNLAGHTLAAGYLVSCGTCHGNPL